ncbi:MAG: N-acetylneuraminate synthase family protein [Candidatus Andersenbacteria bacterium]|nr:N-acetylneuraminate synthase family protein [bacterium]MDZ4225404.1 N-acetylneuraminate synthase family protein [Candidatus Andersenbacteria bacterium]
MSNSEIKPLVVGERKIGPGEPVFVIAEAGINHNGSVARARELIDAAGAAGADAVKFQKRNLAEIYQQKILANPNLAEQRYQVYLPMLKEFELSEENFIELESYAGEKGIIFLVNPWDKDSARSIENSLHVPLYKVGSPDLTNDELLTQLVSFKKPMILSTGMSEAAEIDHAVNLLREQGASFALLHCNNTYPAPFDEINLRFMEKLQAYGVPVGYSGHERGVAVSIAAVARGACIIERHLTVDKSLEGPDHKASLLPDEFKRMVDGMREVEKAVGQPIKKLSRAEVMNRELLGKSVVAAKFIADGTEIARDMLTAKSPAKGLSPQRMTELIGTKAQRDVFAGEFFTEDDLASAAQVEQFNGAGILWKWGVVVRWHDFAEYLKYEPRLFEFHLSDKDLDEDLPAGKFAQEVIVHAPEYMHRTYLNPAAEDAVERKIALDTLQRSVDVARRLADRFTGTPKLVIHPGGITLQPHEEPGKLLEIFTDTLSRLKTDGVEILPENLPPRPWVFGGEWVTNIFLLAEEIKNFLDKTGYKMCFDTSHAALACNAAGGDLIEQVKILRPYIRHLHISDGSGIGEEGLQIGKGTIDWGNVLTPLAGYEHTFVPEIWQGHLHGGRGFLQALEHLKPYLR